MKAKKLKKALAKAPKLTPRATRSSADAGKDFAAFPVEHYSYSAMALFSSNPFMFKVKYMNGETIDTTIGSTTVLGQALHRAMETYFGGGDAATAVDEGEAIKAGYDAGAEFLQSFSDGLIDWRATVPDRQKMMERYSFAYFAYVKELAYDGSKQENLVVEKKLKHRVSVDGRLLPVPLVARADRVYREKGEIVIEDHKFVSKWSDEDAIEGGKLLQAAVAYLVIGAELGEMPARMKFNEVKITENRDKSERQTRTFTIEYAELPLLFDFFFRFYEDMTNALLGHQAFVPNIHAMFDNEVSLLAYIHRLDVDEEKAKKLNQAKVETITDFLRRKIARTRSLKKFEETIAKKFISAKTLNYKTMTTEEKIRMKLAEHGINVDFDSKVVGPSVTLYRYDPSVGVKMTRLEAFVKDIELVTAASGVRVLAPIAGTDLVGFEVPNKERTFPGEAPRAQNLRIAIGVDVQGHTQYVALQDAPHLLLAGTTGSGKSVLLRSILGAIGGSADLWLMDPKRVELGGIDSAAYADEPDAIAAALDELVGVMEERYATMKKDGKRQWEGRKIVLVVDEFGDLMLNKKGQGESIKRSVLTLAQKARASGIHIILTTQRPSVKVVDGEIKANFPTRIALKTASPKDSEIILGVTGAEKLCGKGDLLLMRSDSSDLIRLQGFSA